LQLQINKHDDLIEKYFGQRPTVFRNTELIYSDEIGSMVCDMGFKAMLTEGAKHVLGWKSPGYLYTNAINPRLKILMRNYKLSDDISFRFSNHAWSEFPLTTEKFTDWMLKIDQNEEVINLFMDYETFGEHQATSTGIMEFLRELPNTVLKSKTLEFNTPSNIIEILQPVSSVHVPYPISWADEERDLSAWLGNEMQQEAFNKLYSLLPRVEKCEDPEIQKDWGYLQISDHLYYMCTKFFSDGEVHKYFNPYDSPYEAFINYMNVLSDFALRLDKLIPENETELQLYTYQKLIDEKEEKIKKLEAELKGKEIPKRTVKTSKSVVKKVVPKKK
jgi:alpha-amylase